MTVSAYIPAAVLDLFALHIGARLPCWPRAAAAGYGLPAAGERGQQRTRPRNTAVTTCR